MCVHMAVAIADTYDVHIFKLLHIFSPFSDSHSHAHFSVGVAIKNYKMFVCINIYITIHKVDKFTLGSVLGSFFSFFTSSRGFENQTYFKCKRDQNRWKLIYVLRMGGCKSARTKVGLHAICTRESKRTTVFDYDMLQFLPFAFLHFALVVFCLHYYFAHIHLML